jgi:hypothetical protein
MTDRADDDRYSFYPFQVIPELYADLDLQLLTATDDTTRWAALIAGTREVLDRLDHLAAPNIICATGTTIIQKLAECVQQFDRHGATELAGWLQDVIDVLTAHQTLQENSAIQIRQASGHGETVAAILDAAASLRVAAEAIAVRRFPDYPSVVVTQLAHNVMGAAAGTFGVENHRNPLRKQLDGVGGAAGSPEFNPYVAALYELELNTHRRLYRLFYNLLDTHLGIRLSDDELFATPDDVDVRPF